MKVTCNVLLTQRQEANRFGVLPGIYRMAAKTSLDDADLKKAKYVIVLSDHDGFLFTLCGQTNQQQIAWLALYNREDGQANGEFAEMFLAFNKLPTRRNKLFKLMLDTLCNQPLGSRERLVKAIVYSTSLEQSGLVLTEERVYHLVWPILFPKGVTITATDELSKLFQDSHSSIVRGPYFKHITFNLNYSFTSEMMLDDISGETVCGLPIAALEGEPNVSLLLGGGGIDNSDGSMNVDCPNCRANFLLYKTQNPHLTHLTIGPPAWVFASEECEKREEAVAHLIRELRSSGIELLLVTCTSCGAHVEHFGEIQDDQLLLTCCMCDTSHVWTMLDEE